MMDRTCSCIIPPSLVMVIAPCRKETGSNSKLCRDRKALKPPTSQSRAAETVCTYLAGRARPLPAFFIWNPVVASRPPFFARRRRLATVCFAYHRRSVAFLTSLVQSDPNSGVRRRRLRQKNGNRHSGNATKNGRGSVATEQSVRERKNVRVVQSRQTIPTGTSRWHECTKYLVVLIWVYLREGQSDGNCVKVQRRVRWGNLSLSERWLVRRNHERCR